MSYTESSDGTIMLDDGTVLEPLGEDEIEPWASDPTEVTR